MGRQRYKALVLKKLRELCKEHSLKDLEIHEYHEQDDEISFILSHLKEVHFYLLQAFADLFLTDNVSVISGRRDLFDISPKSRIIIKNPDLTNIHRSKRLIPEPDKLDDRFDLDLDEPDE